MKTRVVISIILFSFAAGGAVGYLLRAQKTDGSLVVSAKDFITEEYLAAPDTFSRIKNTRNSLDSLSIRLGIGITDALAAYDRLPKTNEAERRKADEVLDRALHTAEAAMREFEGTQQQWVVATVFLEALRKAGRLDRWIEVYIETLYRCPTHPAVSNLANDAVKIGRLAGQELRVLEALRYVSASPAEFSGRAEVEAALDSAPVSVGGEDSARRGQRDNPPSL
jgi:hypothetical protein